MVHTSQIFLFTEPMDRSALSAFSLKHLPVGPGPQWIWPPAAEPEDGEKEGRSLEPGLREEGELEKGGGWRERDHFLPSYYEMLFCIEE